MTTQTSLLRLILPVQGEFSGTWGDQVNAGLTNLIDTAVAGTTSLTGDADVTLSTANYAADQARSAILLCTGARTAIRNIIAPSSSKVYLVINATTFSTVLKGAATTGVTIPAGAAYLCAWNGSDFTSASAATATTATNASLVNGLAIGYLGVPMITQAPATAMVLADAGKAYIASAAGTWTIPANTGVAFPVGTTLGFINPNSSTCTIQITGPDTLTLAGTVLTGNRTLIQNGQAVALKVTATSWLISGAGVT
jgi:hypothetical protein